TCHEAAEQERDCDNKSAPGRCPQVPRENQHAEATRQPYQQPVYVESEKAAPGKPSVQDQQRGKRTKLRIREIRRATVRPRIPEEQLPIGGEISNERIPGRERVIGVPD